MLEQKPENKWVTVLKLIGVCVICVGVIYGIVTLVSALST